MLTFEQIANYFSPELVRANPKGILVEYLQHELLDSIYKEPGSEKLSFIGGTAIRILYESHRFSEDLDFDNFGLDSNDFQRLLEKACHEMRLKGVELEHEFVVKKPHAHCYIKFPALLQKLAISGHREEKILVSVDAELKEKIFEPEVKTLNKFGIYRNILANPREVLLAQKLLAILFRKRERGRDFYDASFLWGLTDPDYSYIAKLTSLPVEKFKKKLLEHCGRLDYKSLAEDVLPFLFKAEQKERVLAFKSLLKDKLGNA